MLESLSISNFALIEQVTLHLSSGLTMITGETGSGKSTLIGALKLIRGDRAQASQIRTGKDRSKIEAIFNIEGDQRVLAHLKKLGIKETKRLKIVRILKRKGRNLIQVNGNPIGSSDLQALMSEMIEISAQNEAQHLRQASAHLDILDQAGRFEKIRQSIEQTYEHLTQIDYEIAHAHATQDLQHQQEDFLKYQLQELQEARLTDALEDERLKQEALRLKYAQKLKENAVRAEAVLYSLPNSAIEQLNEAIHAFNHLVEVDTQLSPLLDDLHTALALTEEVARSASDYANDLESQPHRLEEIEERLDLLSNLKKKHNGSLAQVIEKMRYIELELQSFESLEERLLLLKEQRRVIGQSLLTQAQALSEARRRFSPTLCKSIERELKDLGMPKARLEMEFEPTLPSQGCQIEDHYVGPRGLERANLLISANPGEPLLPIQVAASGGEISRIILAIKRVIADQDPVNTYVFDEVDSGVGGPTAEALGLKLLLVSKKRQVFCITHLPQVAAIGNQHILVSKHVKGDRTRSVVKVLNHQQRVEELSRMLGGARITQTTRANAEELLSIADSFSQESRST